jgi:hypothetical protein
MKTTAMRIFLACVLILPLAAQTPAPQQRLDVQYAEPPAPAGQGALDYVCPMDPDVRSDKPGKCPRCGMTLKLGIADQSEFPLELTATPANIRPGEKVVLKFALKDPKTGAIVKKYEIVHEKLLHMFIVSGDLQYFLHDHPVLQPDGTFLFTQVFPKAGMYRVVTDIYPTSGTPQLIPRTLFVLANANDPVPLEEAKLTADMTLQHGENTDAQVTMDPPKPIAGTKTHVWFKFNTADGMQKYLGAWAHMLISSDDMVDLIHQHPFIADGSDQMQFDIIFPRARTYRVWVQIKRKDVVNTFAVNIPVLTLEQAAGINTGQ